MGAIGRLRGEARRDEALVDVELVFEEGDPERLRLQMVAELFETAGGLLKRLKGPRRFALRLAQQAKHAVCLVGQHRRLGAGQLLERGAARLLRERHIAGLQRQARQQQIAERRLARQQRSARIAGAPARRAGGARRSARRETARAPRRNPGGRARPGCARSRTGGARESKSAMRTPAIAAARGEREDRHRLRRFVIHAELFEAFLRLRRELGGLVAQIQLEIDLRSIEIA